MAKALGTALKFRRKALAMTQGAVARSLGVSRSAVGQWEAGTHEPSTENLIAVCELLGLNIDATVKGEIAVRLYDQLVEGFERVDAEGGTVDLEEAQIAAQKLIDIAVIGSGHSIDLRHSEADSNRSLFFMFAKPMYRTGRPLALVGKEQAYCTTICSEHLSPKFTIGERIYVDPGKSAKLGDFVIVKSLHRSETAGDMGINNSDVFICIMGKLRARDVQSLTIERFNPPELISVPLAEDTTIDRICSLHELIAF